MLGEPITAVPTDKAPPSVSVALSRFPAERSFARTRRSPAPFDGAMPAYLTEEDHAALDGRLLRRPSQQALRVS